MPVPSSMPLEMTWDVLAVRLICTLVAGAIIGFDRGERGKAAGLRTTVLVCAAASIAMLQVNYLLAVSGKTSDSFITNDLMRLPLGILTGVGFIGAGAILRRDDIVTGVTTAATLWFVTVIGMCFGGGQLTLGWTGTAVGCGILWGLRYAERALPVQPLAKLSVTVDGLDPSESELSTLLRNEDISAQTVSLDRSDDRQIYVFEIVDEHASALRRAPAVVQKIAALRGVSCVRWEQVP